MKLGVFTALFGSQSRTDTLEIVKEVGLDAVEFGAGAYPGAAHLDVAKLLTSKDARDQLLRDVDSRGLTISALSVHGNPLHPNKQIAEEHHQVFVNAVKLASLLGVECVNGFSGCPGEGPGSKMPNWVTCAWPDEFREILEWQWNEVAIPYWTAQADFLAAHKVKFCIEMHPGFIVYNNESLLRLRHSSGKNGEWIGANFDPSHLWWQGIDPIVATRQLAEEGALFHVHAKDVRVDPTNSSVNGNLDTKSYGDISQRSWVFRSVGYGHSAEWWKDFVSTLRTYGYDWVLSIEHEDGLMSSLEGLKKAIGVLREAVIVEPAGPMFWAKD